MPAPFPYIATYDCETDGVNIEDTRIVTASLLVLDRNGAPLTEQSWVINTGREMPKDAADVHGWTTEKMQRQGEDSRASIDAIRAAIERLPQHLPLVIYNAPFDTTVLDRECRRHRLAVPVWPGIIDPLVCDKALSRRRGSRRLVDVAAHHKVKPPEGDAHEARYDALLAGGVAIKLRDALRREHESSATGMLMPFMEWMQEWQAARKKEQAESFQEYLRTNTDAKGHDPKAFIDPSWPIVPYQNHPKEG